MLRVGTIVPIPRHFYTAIPLTIRPFDQPIHKPTNEPTHRPVKARKQAHKHDYQARLPEVKGSISNYRNQNKPSLKVKHELTDTFAVGLRILKKCAAAALTNFLVSGYHNPISVLGWIVFLWNWNKLGPT